MRPEEAQLLHAIAAASATARDLAGLSAALPALLGGPRRYRMLLEPCGGLRGLCAAHRLLERPEIETEHGVVSNPRLTQPLPLALPLPAGCVALSQAERRVLRLLARVAGRTVAAAAAELQTQLGVQRYRAVMRGLPRLEQLCRRWGLLPSDEATVIDAEAVHRLRRWAGDETVGTEDEVDHDGDAQTDMTDMTDAAAHPTSATPPGPQAEPSMRLNTDSWEESRDAPPLAAPSKLRVQRAAQRLAHRELLLCLDALMAEQQVTAVRIDAGMVAVLCRRVSRHRLLQLLQTMAAAPTDAQPDPNVILSALLAWSHDYNLRTPTSFVTATRLAIALHHLAQQNQHLPAPPLTDLVPRLPQLTRAGDRVLARALCDIFESLNWPVSLAAGQAARELSKRLGNGRLQALLEPHGGRLGAALDSLCLRASGSQDVMGSLVAGYSLVAADNELEGMTLAELPQSHMELLRKLMPVSRLMSVAELNAEVDASPLLADEKDLSSAKRQKALQLFLERYQLLDAGHRMFDPQSVQRWKD